MNPFGLVRDIDLITHKNCVFNFSTTFCYHNEYGDCRWNCPDRWTAYQWCEMLWSEHSMESTMHNGMFNVTKNPRIFAQNINIGWKLVEKPWHSIWERRWEVLCVIEVLNAFSKCTYLNRFTEWFREYTYWFGRFCWTMKKIICTKPAAQNERNIDPLSGG